MSLVIVSGSQRPHSESARVAEYITRAAVMFEHTRHIELCQMDLPFWDGSQQSRANHPHWNEISDALNNADAIALVTPEWGGMASPLMKNFLLMCEQHTLAHKPLFLSAVVSGVSGTYPIAELKMNALKNLKSVVVPDHLIVRNVNDLLHHSEQVSERDQSLRTRIDYYLHMLKHYTDAMVPLRERISREPHPQQQQFIYGM
ncbi:NADPH-dependent FMN reductase [Echinimonas agarilytica]|nr:NAD(P)H-dependent oxidoreductase [Echinimonas agarilytica]